MTTGSKLKNFRLNRGISQLDLELAVCASTGTVSRIENNKINPTKETLLKIADFLKLDPFETISLFGFNNSTLEMYIPKRILNQRFLNGDTLLSSLNGSFENHAFLKGVNYFIKECDDSLETTSTEVLYLHSLRNWRNVYKEEYANTYHVPIRMEKNKFARFLMNDLPEAHEFQTEDKSHLRQTKILNNINFDYNLMILDDQVTIFLGEPTALTLSIKDVQLAKKFKNIFNETWNSTNP